MRNVLKFKRPGHSTNPEGKEECRDVRCVVTVTLRGRWTYSPVSAWSQKSSP